MNTEELYERLASWSDKHSISLGATGELSFIDDYIKKKDAQIAELGEMLKRARNLINAGFTNPREYETVRAMDELLKKVKEGG